MTDCSYFLVSLTASKLKKFKAAYRVLRSSGVEHETAIRILVEAGEKLNAYADGRRVAIYGAGA